MSMKGLIDGYYLLQIQLWLSFPTFAPDLDTWKSSLNPSCWHRFSVTRHPILKKRKNNQSHSQRKECHHWQRDAKNRLGPLEDKEGLLSRRPPRGTSYKFIVWRLVVVNWLNRRSIALPSRWKDRISFFKLSKSKQQSVTYPHHSMNQALQTLLPTLPIISIFQ